MELAGQHQLAVLVADEAAPLEVHHEGVSREEISPRMGFFTLATSKSQMKRFWENCRAIILEP